MPTLAKDSMAATGTSTGTAAAKIATGRDASTVLAAAKAVAETNPTMPAAPMVIPQAHASTGSRVVTAVATALGSTWRYPA